MLRVDAALLEEMKEALAEFVIAQGSEKNGICDAESCNSSGDVGWSSSRVWSPRSDLVFGYSQLISQAVCRWGKEGSASEREGERRWSNELGN